MLAAANVKLTGQRQATVEDLTMSRSYLLELLSAAYTVGAKADRAALEEFDRLRPAGVTR